MLLLLRPIGPTKEQLELTDLRGCTSQKSCHNWPLVGCSFWSFVAHARASVLLLAPTSLESRAVGWQRTDRPARRKPQPAASACCRSSPKQRRDPLAASKSGRPKREPISPIVDGSRCKIAVSSQQSAVARYAAANRCEKTIYGIVIVVRVQACEEPLSAARVLR